MLERLGWPMAFASWRDRHEASEIAGIRLAAGAIWLPDLAAEAPIARCAAQIAAIRNRQAPTWHPKFGRLVAALRRIEGSWHALDAGGTEIAIADVVVCANAHASVELAAMSTARLTAVAGRTTHFVDPRFSALRTALGGDAYALPAGGGQIATSATAGSRSVPPSAIATQPDSPLPANSSAAAHWPADVDRQTLQRLGSVTGVDLPGPGTAIVGSEAGWRATTRDHLPLIGAVVDEAVLATDRVAWQRNDRLPLPRRPGLYVASGFGSRGLLWSTLAAELLAAQICAEPLPIERALLDQVDPGRFLKRALRAAA